MNRRSAGARALAAASCLLIAGGLAARELDPTLPLRLAMDPVTISRRSSLGDALLPRSASVAFRLARGHRARPSADRHARSHDLARARRAAARGVRRPRSRRLGRTARPEPGRGEPVRVRRRHTRGRHRRRRTARLLAARSRSHPRAFTLRHDWPKPFDRTDRGRRPADFRGATPGPARRHRHRRLRRPPGRRGSRAAERQRSPGRLRWQRCRKRWW